MKRHLIVHSISDLRPSCGGTSRVVVDITAILSDYPWLEIVLLTQLSSDGAVLKGGHGRVRLKVASSEYAYALRLGLPVYYALEQTCKSGEVSLIHSHGLWLPANHWTCRIARRYRVPLVIQPHGMLEPWALKYNSWKKRLAMAIYQWRDLEAAKVLVVTAEAEYRNLRQLGLKQPIAVIPNGIHLPVDLASDSISRREAGTPRTVLFLSRIQGKKGLPNLVQAWARLRPVGWRLKIAGPDEAGHLAEVLAGAGQLGVAHTVDYLGEVDGAAKTALYRQADLFVLPTFSENFGLVVAEALAHGLPVITTKGAPWGDLVTYDCGWWIDIGVEPLVDALSAATALTDTERQAMGARGREYVRRYDWPDIARQMAAVYHWVLGQGDRPECVQMD